LAITVKIIVSFRRYRTNPCRIEVAPYREVNGTVRLIERTDAMKKQRRWLAAAIAASAAETVAMPWKRGVRRKPKAVQPVLPRPVAAAAR
jgi:hypothetical protein